MDIEVELKVSHPKRAGQGRNPWRCGGEGDAFGALMALLMHVRQRVPG